MALTSLNSDQNLFEEFDENELSQIFDITNTSIQNMEEDDTEKADDASDSGSETVYIEPMDEDEDFPNDDASSQICTLKKIDENGSENGRRSTGSHDYSRRTSIDSNLPDFRPSIDSYRDDELEYTSFDDDEDDIAMFMSQEEVATQVYDPEEIETNEVQDVSNYGDVELKVDVTACVADVDKRVSEKENAEKEEPSTPEKDPTPQDSDTPDTDTSFGIPNILNSTVSSTVDEDSEVDSQKTVILSPTQIRVDFLNDIPPTEVIDDPVPSTSKEDPQESRIHLPAELSETRAISEDHDYLAKKLPMNFNLVVEETEELVQTNIDHVISLATGLRATNDKDRLAEQLSNILNHISLLQDITQIDNDERVHDSRQSPNSDLNAETIIKEEFTMQENAEDLENLVVQNMENEMSALPTLIQADKEPMEVDTEETPKPDEVPESLEDSLLIDPIKVDIENLEKFAKDIEEKATQWRLTKERSLSKVQAALKDSDAEWRKLMLKFECPRDTAEVGTEIDPKMFAKQNQRAKKDILAFMNDSESEVNEEEELDSEDEARQNLISIVEASYSDALDSEVEDEIGKKLIVKHSEKLPEKEATKDSDEDASDGDSDASIDRLCNLTGLARKIRDTDKKYQSDAPPKKPEKKSLNIEELVNGAEDVAGDESEEELLPPTKAPATEAEFLKKINEEYKRQLLESSDSNMSDDESAISVNSEAHDSESDDSDSSIIMDRFLSSLDQNQKNAIKNGNKPPSMDSGLDEKSPPPKTTVRRRSSAIPTPESKEDDDDALDLSMFKVATQKVKESEELVDLERDLGPDTTESKVPNVEDYISLSSESDNESENMAPVRSRHTRKIMSEEELATETKEAQDAEHDRIKRLDRMEKSMSQILTQRPELEENELVLDYDKKNDEPIAVHAEIVRKLKEHQKEGVKFMYKNCYGPIDDIEKFSGSGCILAHCMGLGKTLQLIALLHTVIRYPRLKTNKILVLCPKSTIMNWYEEFERWISKIKGTRKMKVYCFEEAMTIREKTKILAEWHSSGVVKSEKNPPSWLNKTHNNQAGCLLLGYQAYRSLTVYNPRRKNARPMDEKEAKNIEDIIEKCLITPGADMVVCDEGHVIKNNKSGISKAVSQIRTKRRIILTGTPIQNNLNEYYCMVNWIKPSFLGTEKEFNNRYANPIKQGQHKDSIASEIRQMKRRSFVLHKKLQPFVERKEFTILKDELPKKHEYVLYVPLTEVQTRLYKLYLENLKSELNESEKIKGNNLLPDYTYLRKIWTHPRVLESAYETSRANQNKKATKRLEKNLDKLIERCDEEDLPDDVFDIAGNKGGVHDKWWENFLTKTDLDTLISSYKLQIMVEILRQCEEKGDKCLIFSNFVAVLSVVEFFLKSQMGYINGRNYYRLDGQTPKTRRHQMITMFNRAENQEVKCFLISARAGGQGINLIGANRVIILDTSWNPAADLQSIFRVFRLGQKKTCYVYRLLAMGTMEEKVYSRSVTKQAMSNRVVDEMQVDRHFSYGELAELYTLTEYDMESRPVPDVPVDSVLINLLRLFPQFIYKYHEHDSLLASNDDEELTDTEKAEAWRQYEQEEKEKNNPNINLLQGNQMPMSPFSSNMLQQSPSSYQSYYNNLGNLNNMNSMLSQLMCSMDPYYGLLTGNMPGSNQPPDPNLSPNSLYAKQMMAMAGFGNPMGNLSGGGITSPPTSNPFTGNYRSPPSTSNAASMYNASTDELLTGMRQRSANTAVSPFSTPVRSHPINGVARPRSKNGSDAVPITLSDIQRKPAPSPTAASSPSTKQRSQPSPRASTSGKQAYEEQYMKHFENQIQQPANNKRKEALNSSVIEIPDDDPVASKTKPPAKAPPPSGKVVKNANIGIHYPASTQNKGTPIYLPDLPEGTSINKIPKKVSADPLALQQGKAATITGVSTKQPISNQQRPTSSSFSPLNRAPTTGVDIFKGSSLKPSTTPVQNIQKTVVVPTSRLPKPATSTVIRTQPSPQSSSQPRLIPTNSTTSVKKAVQQITQNSRGNTSITPVTRPSSMVPVAAPNLQGWKRKIPPTPNAPYPVKMIRLNPNMPNTSRK